MQKGLGMSTWQKENIKALRKHAGIVEDKNKQRKKKKKAGPNPLSCLKKKKKTEPTVLNKISKKSDQVKKRKKIKIAPHITEALIAELKNKEV